MSEPLSNPAYSKFSILAAAAADIAVDLLLPTVVYFLLSPTHLSAIVRLTIGGYFVAAKAGAGHLVTEDSAPQHASFFKTFLPGAAIAALATAVTLGVLAAGFSDTTAIATGSLLLALVQGARSALVWAAVRQGIAWRGAVRAPSVRRVRSLCLDSFPST